MEFKLEHDIDSGKYRLVDERGQVNEQVTFYLRSLELRGLSPQSIRANAYDLLAMYRWLQKGEQNLYNLQQTDVLDFIAWQKGRGAQPKSINRRLSTLRSYCRFCTGQDLQQKKGVTFHPPHYKGSGRDRQLGLLQLKKPKHLALRVKVPRKIVEPLERKQVLFFIKTLRKYRDLSIVHLMLLCGLRSREVLSIRLSDLCFEEKRIRVHGKGNIERILPLPDLLQRLIQKYLLLERPITCSHNYLFVVLQSKQRGQQMTPDGLRSLFRHRRNDPKLSNANPHRWRHTFGTDMARSGVGLSTLQKMMGHSDPAMTLQYVNLSLADIANEFQRVSEKIQKRYQTR